MPTRPARTNPNLQPALIDQPGRAPTRKVAAGGVGSAFGAVAGWAALALLAKNGVVLPAEIQTEVTALISGLAATLGGFASAYWTRERAPPLASKWRGHLYDK